MPARSATRRSLFYRAAMVMVALGVAAQGALVLAAESGARLDAILQELAQRRHGHAAFVERQYLAILERPLESSGELFYDAPDRVEKRTLRPKPASLLLDQGTVTVQRATRTYTASLHDYPQLTALMEGMRATLAGDRIALEQSYTLSLDSVDATNWTLALVPRDAAVARVVARIRIVGAGAAVHEVEVQRGDGDRSVMTIHELPGTE